MKTACMYFNSGGGVTLKATPDIVLVDIPDDKDLHEAEVEALERRNCDLEDDASVEEIETALRILGRKLDYSPRSWREVSSFLVDSSVVEQLRSIELPERRDGGRWTGVRFAIYEAFKIVKIEEESY